MPRRRQGQAASVGIDLADIGEVESAIARFGAAYLDRVFTPAEIAAAAAGGTRVLAACFAAKEAAMKALRIEDEAVGWRSIELRGADTVDPQLRFVGRAAELLASAEVGCVAIDVSTTARHAAAVVIVTRKC
jgi:holo-[acyl-carrier protein] synthase